MSWLRLGDIELAWPAVSELVRPSVMKASKSERATHDGDHSLYAPELADCPGIRTAQAAAEDL